MKKGTFKGIWNTLGTGTPQAHPTKGQGVPGTPGTPCSGATGGLDFVILYRLGHYKWDKKVYSPHPNK